MLNLVSKAHMHRNLMQNVMKKLNCNFSVDIAFYIIMSTL